ncbi:MAG: exonuclease [Verrucomicrobiota bacterium]|jgi:DNA polymerase-3 subunit epsilon|nr:exonuclease [Verrucomicrobiota bacterium]
MKSIIDIHSGEVTYAKDEAKQAPSRPFKGKSLLDLGSDYMCVDIETTGFDPEYDDIIELAAVRVHAGSVSKSFSSLVNPGHSLDSFITDLTGITDEMLSTAPPIREVLPQFLSFVGSSVLVAHNANFDINFLYDNSIRCGLSPLNNDFIDTMRISRNVFKEERHHRLKDLVLRFGIPCEVEHRSLSDVNNTVLCYEYMSKYIKQNGICLSVKRERHHDYSPLHKLTPEADDIDPSTSIYGRTFVFTGVLERMVRAEAAQLVVNSGGLCADSVNKNVDFLVLGNGSYRMALKDGKSSKHKKAEQLKLKGQDIEIISENVFFDMLMEGEGE